MRADAAANHRAIVSAARRLIAERGGDVPLSAVAEGAGVGIATLYRRFPLREDLIRAVAVNVRDEVVGLIERHRDMVATDPAIGWPALVRALAAFRPGATIPGIMTAASEIIADRPDANEALEEEIDQVRSAVFDALSGPLEAAKEGGALRADVTATRFMLGLAALTRPLPVGGPKEPGQEEWLTEIYLAGLRPDGPARSTA
ncbi:hypothetical protein GCM10011492_15460 [Flexivirga endophytica]|uniref:HTH tetR-type domain-containing protein n=1 Tax=Flexivirga endophytica TaxID=1849103 RepID=A0A916T2M1_9MICO|nr:TetR/AcrR family transcriptional regulator [Flexivirga endophytica]GGB26182.1 hypothetical protein GCM10011492_15460 [Flexivirga endophytica]GHB54702.1 hypothetical protein GCM10008112_24780 [Flexivirga endophytica]